MNTFNQDPDHKNLHIVKQLLQEFDPTGFVNDGAPDEDYEHLAIQLLGHASAETSPENMKTLILREVEHYYGSPNIQNLQEPFKTEFHQDLDPLITKLKTALTYSC